MMYSVSAINEPFKFLECGKLHRTRPFVQKQRKLNCFDIMLGIQGSLFVTQNGQKFELTPKHFLVLFPGTEHYGFQESTPPLTYYWCHFTMPGSYDFLSAAKLDRRLAEIDQSSCVHKLEDLCILPELGKINDTEHATQLFSQLIDYSRQNFYSGRVLDYAVNMLCMELTQNTLDEFFLTRKNMINRRKINEIAEFLRLNCGEKLSVCDVAAKFNYNPDYLSTAFRRISGLTLLQYIHKMRITEAKRLLVNTTLSVKEIANTVGFFDDKYFMKIFKKHETVTPTKYRNTFSNTSLNGC